MSLFAMGWKLSHIGIAVKDIDTAIQTYKNICAELTVGERVTVQDQQVEVCFLDFPEAVGVGRIELLSAIDDSGPVAKFIETRGEGLHHACFACPNIEEKLAELRNDGFTLIDGTPRIGALGKRIAFVHPKSVHGTLLELEEE